MSSSPSLRLQTIAVKPSLPPLSKTRLYSTIRFRTQLRTQGFRVCCQVAVERGPKVSAENDNEPCLVSPPMINGRSRVRVTAPVKVYHVPRVQEVDLIGMDGQVKQHIAVFKGKQISPNLPFKVEFVKEIEGRGAVKFFAHLREDEFELI